jgi:nucleoside-diphosphate-sugar epimerase
MLEGAGVEPVIGSLQSPDSYRAAAAQTDVLVHAAADYSGDTAELDRLTVEAMLDLVEGAHGEKSLLYTSGTWVYGDTGGRIVDGSPTRNPIEAVAWRPSVEDRVLQAGAVVIRPAVVYGEGGGMTAEWFRAAETGDDITIVGDGENHWAMVHVQDLAWGYVLAAEKGIPGSAYDFADDGRSTVREMAEAVLARVGQGGRLRYLTTENAGKQMGVMAEALLIDQQIGTTRAQQDLGWIPRHSSFVQELTAEVAR